MSGILTTEHQLFTKSSITITRGHDQKLEKIRVNTLSRQKYFTYRVIDTWNLLPQSVVDAKTLHSFKTKLDYHWKNKEGSFSYNNKY